jgi:hypothetical protein
MIQAWEEQTSIQPTKQIYTSMPDSQQTDLVTLTTNNVNITKFGIFTNEVFLTLFYNVNYV